MFLLGKDKEVFKTWQVEYSLRLAESAVVEPLTIESLMTGKNLCYTMRYGAVCFIFIAVRIQPSARMHRERPIRNTYLTYFQALSKLWFAGCEKAYKLCTGIKSPSPCVELLGTKQLLITGKKH